jgi:hypothetical protein
MAIFQLGALVTEIVGSIGGTTFKRQGSSRVMMKKSKGASRSRLFQNPRLGNNAVIFKKWSTLSAGDKSTWNTIASTNTVIDRFGNSVNISGVAFQRKSDLNVIYLGELPDPDTWSPLINSASFFTTPQIDWFGENFPVSFSLPGGNTKIALMLEFSLNPLTSPQFISRGVFYYGEFIDEDGQQAYFAMMERFPFLGPIYNIRLYAYVYTESGVVGPMFQSTVLEV